MLLSDKRHKFIDLRSQPFVGDERNPEHRYKDVLKPLLRLEEYVRNMVDAVCTNPDEYNDYVEANLPYWKKQGVIRRSVLNGICPLYRRVEDPELEIDLLEAVRDSQLTVLKEMTLNVYMHYWRLAYVAYRTHNDFEPDSPDEYVAESDRELIVPLL